MGQKPCSVDLTQPVRVGKTGSGTLGLGLGFSIRTGGSPASSGDGVGQDLASHPESEHTACVKGGPRPVCVE